MSRVKTLQSLFKRYRRPGDIVFAWLALIVSVFLLSQVLDQTTWKNGGKLFALNIGCAAGYHQPRIGPIAPRAADRLARLAHCFAGDRAGIDDHDIAAVGEHALHPLALSDVETAAKGNDLRLEGLGRVHPKSSHSKLPR